MMEVILFLCFFLWGACLRTVSGCDFSAIPVQENFDASQFEGVWYTIGKTSNNLHSAVRRYRSGENGDLKFAFTALHPLYGRCIPPIIQTLERDEQPGQYILRNYQGHDALVKIAYTDYNSALVYVCIDRNPRGICALVIAETMSRNSAGTPLSSNQQLSNIIGAQGCVVPSQLQSTSQEGSCPPPEFSRQRNRRQKRNTGGSCPVDGIPISSSFSMSQMRGIWYEIARTRLTFNQMESGVFNYIYNDNTQILTGLYSGTKAGVCQQAFPGQSRKKTLNGPEGDLMARIGGDDSLFPWSPFKILYADANHIFFYACYGLNDDGTCETDKTEVTLISKSRGVSNAMKQRMANMLPSVCLSPTDLVSSDLRVDCRDVALNAASDSLPDVSSCVVDGIRVQENFDIDRFLGDWYVIGAIEYGQKIHNKRTFVRYVRGTGNYVWELMSHASHTGCQETKRYMMKPRCASTRNGNYLTTYGSGMRTQWTSMKILVTDYNFAVIYTCTQEKLTGTCDAAGITVRLLVRDSSLSKEAFVPVLSNVLPSVCANPSNMTSLPSTGYHCFDNLPQSINALEERCDVERISIRTPYINQARLAGLWYEIFKTPDQMFSMHSTLVYYKVDQNNFLSLQYTGYKDGMNQCIGPFRGTTRPRCINTINGEYLGRMQMPGQNMWVTWKILYTDYYYTIAYSCTDTREDGTCAPSGIKFHILSRNRASFIEPHRWDQLIGIVNEACIDPSTLIHVQHNRDCRSVLDMSP